jgi:hypothetical protein
LCLRREWFNIVVGIVWELAMVAAPIFLVIQHYPKALLCGGVFAVTSLILKCTWYNHLEPAKKPAKTAEILPNPAAD